MLNDKETQDLIKYLTLMTERFRETVGAENFHSKASLTMRAYDVALRALTTPIFAGDVSEEDLEKALNDVSPFYLINTDARDARDDKILGEVKMTMPATEPDRCNHIRWWNPATMNHICSKCRLEQSSLTGLKKRCNHKWQYCGNNNPYICSLCGSSSSADEIARGEF